MLKSKRAKRQFVRELLKGIQENLTSKIEQLPEDWDGHELRQWIADTVQWSAVGNTPMKGQRMKDYLTTVLRRDLLRGRDNT